MGRPLRSCVVAVVVLAGCALPYQSSLSSALGSLPLGGDIVGVHDPMLVKIGDTYHLYSSGENIQVRTSADLREWTYIGDVFDGTPPRPAWIDQKIPDNQGLWAPDVSYFGGTYHLYYAVSKGGGSTVSCIGHAGFSGSTFVDQGPVICSNVDTTVDWNALDPNVILDDAGTPWLVFGSWLAGIKMIQLDANGNPADTVIHDIATRTPKQGIEAPFIIHRDGYYYLFTSWDKCCRGISSTYNIRVGRSQDVTGPYVDVDGVSLLQGGGTLLVQGDLRWHGPGHNAIFMEGDYIYNVYHAYDLLRDGNSVLHISYVAIDDAGWPVSGGP